MKKVLILAYDFPPYNSIGAQRSSGWFQYLKEFGVEPIVVTRQWDMRVQNPYITNGYQKSLDVIDKENGQILYAPYKQNLRDRILSQKKNFLWNQFAKVLSLTQLILEFFIPCVDNKRTIYMTAKKYLEENPVDVIIATGEPFILFSYAKKLSVEFRVPWITDYRDGWSTNYNHPKWLRFFYWPIEKRITKTAKLITTASISFQQQLKKLFPPKQIEVIYNGYFEELFEKFPVKTSSDVLKIGFSGTLYPYQPIEKIILALYNSIEVQGIKKYKFLFVGLKDQPSALSRLKQELASSILEKCEFTKKIHQTDAIQKLNECQILLLPSNPNYPQLYAKVFEYMALKKPILYYKPDNSDLSNVLSGFNLSYSAKNTQELSEISDKIINDIYTKNLDPNNHCQKYSRRHSTARLAEILKSI